MDVLYMDTNGGIKVAIGTSQSSDIFEIEYFFSKYVLTSADDSNCKDPSYTDPISTPNSNAFIDFNGDCLPDIFLTRETEPNSSNSRSYYEIYSQVFVQENGASVSKYCLSAQNGQIVEPGMPMPLINMADFNRDGMWDLSFITQTGALTVLYNQYAA